MIASLGPVLPGEKRYLARAGITKKDASVERVQCLLDSAADLNLISQFTVKRLGLEAPPPESTVSLQWGTSPTFHSFGMHRLSIRVRDSNDVERVCEGDFHAVDLGGMDVEVVLGIPWLEKEDPDVSFKSHRWRFPLEREAIEVDTERRSLKRLMRNNRRMFICALSEIYPKPDGKEKVPIREIPVEFRDYSDVFSDEGHAQLAEHGPGEHQIDLIDGEEPPYGPLYPLSARELEVLREYLDNALEKGWIRPSTSPAGAPILFVPKKDGGMRLCVDYRGLNKITIKNRCPLPLINETLDRLVGAKYFTKLDLRDAYYRIRIKNGDEWKTAFRTRYGHFEYTVMPFGLANAPATFQAYINGALRGLLDVSCSVYLDDILIYSKTREEHIKHVAEVLERLRQFKLFAKPSKCTFLTDRVEFLGFVVDSTGVSMEESRVEAIQGWEPPTSIKELQIFLGFANFYRRFVRGYSELTAPMTNLLKGTKNGKQTGPFTFTNDAKKAFRELKDVFSTAPVLRHFDPERHMRMETDASGYAVGGILSQPWVNEDGKTLWHPIAYMSRKLSDAEGIYETHDKELLAIVEMFKRWRHYLHGVAHPIEVLCDHHNLKYFMTTTVLNGRQARWALELAKFDFEIKFRPGKTNPADPLSRRPDFASQEKEQSQVMLPTLQRKLQGSFIQACIRRGAGETLSRPKDLEACRRDDGDTPEGLLGLSSICESRSAAGRTSGLEESLYSSAELVRGFDPRGCGERLQIGDTTNPLEPRREPSAALASGARTPPQREFSGWGTEESPVRDMCVPPSRKVYSVRKTYTPGLREAHPGRDFPERPVGGEHAGCEVARSSLNPLAGTEGCKLLVPRHIATRVMSLTVDDTLGIPLAELLLSLQQSDDFVKKKKAAIESKSKRDTGEANGWRIDQNGLLRRHDAVFVPADPAVRDEILLMRHDDPLSGHFGVDRTLALLRQDFYWPGMDREVSDYIESCEVCQRTTVKRHRPYGELQSLPIPKGPWEEITMDFITDLPPSAGEGTAFDAILVIVDRFTKFAIYIAVTKTITAEELAQVIEKRLISYFGAPMGIVSDRGPIFTSHFWSALCHHLKIKRRLSTAFHPQTDGQTERQNQILEQYLRCFCTYHQDDWYELLHRAQFCYNNSVQSTIKMTPSFALMGFYPKRLLNLADAVPGGEVPSARERVEIIQRQREDLVNRWKKAVEYQAKSYNKKHTPLTLNPDDWVMLSTKNLKQTRPSKKLADRYVGPFKILETVGKQAYRLALPEKWRIHPVFHVSLLEPHHRRAGEDPASHAEPVILESGEEWEVEEILNKRKRWRSDWYLVKWKGFPIAESTWVRLEDLENAQDIVNKYESKHGATGKKRKRK